MTRMTPITPFRAEIAHNIVEWASPLTPAGLVQAHREHCESLGIELDSTEAARLYGAAVYEAIAHHLDPTTTPETQVECLHAYLREYLGIDIRE